MILLVAIAAGTTVAAEPAILFWPDEVPAAIHAEVDGVAALETVRELSRHHRVQGSPGLAAAAEHLRQKLLGAGLADAQVRRYPADGATKYAHFRGYYGWTADEGILEEVSPMPRVIAAFPRQPVALADYSQDADVTALLVDVGPGTEAADYEGKPIEGKIVLADGPLPRVHRLAVEERKAAGFLSAYPNQTTGWSGEDQDLVRWGHLTPYNLGNTFAFMVSKRQAARLRARLAGGEKISLRARVKAKMTASTYDVVDATIPGTDLAEEEIILTAHLCHQSAGANDNASGSAAIFEVARALGAAIREGKLPAPRRTIRFLWLPEIAGSQAYLVSNPEIARRMVAGIHMDMVGGLISTTRGTFHLARTAESLPHVANVIARVWLDHLTAATARFAEGGGDPYAGFVWPPGSREMFLADLRGIEMGSDHQVFEEGTHAIPMLYFHDWPDVTIHTNKDQPENLDATKLGRVAYLGAGVAWTLAALPDSMAGRLLEVTRAATGVRMAEARLRAALVESGQDGPIVEREALLGSMETLETLAAMWPTVGDETRREIRRLEKALPDDASSPPRDARVPSRNPEVRGPIDVYYYDHLTEILGPDADTATALSKRPEGSVLAWEALNLVDGKRSVSDIRDILTGRYVSIPVSEIAEHFELLERAGVVHLP